MGCVGGGGGALVANDAQKEITLRPAEWSLEAVETLRQAEAYDTTGGLFSIEDYAEGRAPGVLFVAEHEGRALGYIVLTVNHMPRGTEGVIAYAAGRRGFARLLPRLLPVIESRFVGARVLKVETRRKGLAACLVREGWHVAGYILRKKASCETKH